MLDDDAQEPALINFAKALAPTLPHLLQEVIAHAETEAEADVLLLGALATLSGALPNVQAMHHHKYLTPHIYLFVAGPASCGKGRLAECRHLLDTLKSDYDNRNADAWAEYQEQMRLFSLDRKHNEEPPKPPRRMLFIPANSSNAAFYKALADNHGNGIIFETEGDTLANTLKTDFGNYSDILHKAFHHETISLYRKTNDEYIDIQDPHLAVVLSGTPAQIASLIPSTENGLFSRFLFYTMPLDLEWRSGFDQSPEAIDASFARLGEDFYRLHCMLRSRSTPLEFVLLSEQQQRFDDFFAQRKHALTHAADTIEDGALSSLHRMAIITLRIAMVLSILRFLDRNEDPSLPRFTHLYCPNNDFTSALTIAEACLGHDDDVNAMLNASRPANASHIVFPGERILSSLPNEFTMAQALAVGKRLNISERTVRRALQKMLSNGNLCRTRRAIYSKVTPGIAPNRNSQ